MSKDSFTCGRCKNQNTFSCTYCDGRTCFREFPSDKEIAYHNKTRKDNIDTMSYVFDQQAFSDYVRRDVEMTRRLIAAQSSPEVKDVIFNDPATIVLWKDGTKTVVKAQEGCEFDPWVGLAMAFSKKMFGNKGNYFEVFKKYCEPYEEKMADDQDFSVFLDDTAKKIVASLAALSIPALRINIEEFKKKDEEQTIGTKVNGFTLVTEHYGYTMAYPDNFSKPEYYVCHKDELHLIDDLNHRNTFYHSALERNAKSMAVKLELQHYILKDDK